MFSKLVNDASMNHSSFNKNYALLADLDFDTAQTLSSFGTFSNDWQLNPVGTVASPFYGNFDGNNHRIYNLKIKDPAMDDVGFVGVLGGSAYLRNVALISCDFEGNSYVGGLVGRVDPSQAATAPNNTVGNGNSHIEKCFATGSLSGASYVGGLLGASLINVLNNRAYLILENCYSKVNVSDMGSGSLTVGTFAGSVEGSTVNSVYTVATSPTNKFIGNFTSGDIFNTFGWEVSSDLTVTAKTKTEMRADAFLTDLATSAWSLDDKPWTRNSGYPVLGYEPLATDVCIIEDGQVIEPTTAAHFTSRPKKIIIEDGGTLHNTIVGSSYEFGNDATHQVVVERNLYNETYNFIGHSFGGGASAGDYQLKVSSYLGVGANNTPYYTSTNGHITSIVRFNYGTNMWSGDPGGLTYLGYNSDMDAGIGYLAYVLDDDTYWDNDNQQWVLANEGRKIKLSYSPSNKLLNRMTTSKSYTLTNGGNPHTIESPLVDGHWFSLSNPYSGDMNVRKFIQTNPSQGNVVYTLNPLEKTWNAIDGTDCSERVKIGEGFFIAVSSSSTPVTKTVTFNSTFADLCTGSKSLIEKLRITAVTNGKSKYAEFKFNEDDATNGFDVNDAYMRFGTNEKIVEPFFMVEGRAIVKNSVGALPYPAALQLYSMKATETDLRFDNIPEDVRVIFIDLAFGSIDTIVEGGVERVAIDEGYNAGRFVVLLERKANSLIDVENYNDLHLWAYKNRLTVKGTDLENIEVFNTLGREIYGKRLSGNSFNTELNVGVGSYIAKVTSKTGTRTIKFIITK